MRILIPAIDFGAGGAERVLAWLAGKLVADGHDVTVLTWRHPDTDFFELPDNATRHFVSRSVDEAARPRLGDYVRYLHTLRSLARGNDVAISFLTDLNVFVLLATLGVPTPVIVSERLHPLAGSRRGLAQRIRPLLYRRRARLVVVQTADVAEIARRDWGVSDVVTIPNPAMVAISPGVEADHRKTVLAVGRLVEQKDHATLIRAWARVHAAVPEWSLRIAGSGPLLHELQGLASTLGVAGSIVFLGRVDDIDSEFRDAPIFVMSSVAEGFPNALVEAVSHGCACLATDCPGGSAEILLHGDGGILVAPRSTERLAQGLLDLIGDPALRRRLSGAAAAGLARYDEDAVFALWSQALEGVVEPAPASRACAVETAP